MSAFSATRPPGGDPSPTRSGYAPSRRDLLRAAGLVAAGAAVGGGVTGCGAQVRSGFTGSPPGPKVLTYWNLLGGGDGVRMQDMQAVYEKANPDV
ncbi:MAG TPA: hypothetical protein VE287_00920, partial [Actinopolymorphaceae bacterium]|nr:hypothetical protein [Actinopolymorphaceae bacterium]